MAWNQERLAELKRQYAEGHDGMPDPRFDKVLKKVLRGGRYAPPYSGVPTLLDAPHRVVDAEQPDFGDLQVALLGIPMDLGVTNRSGARFGPRALRAIERIGPYHHVLQCAPVFDLRVADIGDVPLRSAYRLEMCLDDIERWIGLILAAGVIPLSVGGDHSVTFPVLKAMARQHGPVGLIHLDAHCDTGGPMGDTKFHHGGPFRNAVLEGALDPTRTIQIGIRGAAEFLWSFSFESGMTVIHAEDVPAMGIEAVIARARSVVGAGPVYVSLDIDGIDPAFAPGTGTPEVGGLSTREALALLRGLQGLPIVGGDVVEVAPQYDPSQNTAQVGAQLLFELLSLVARGPLLAGGG